MLGILPLLSVRHGGWVVWGGVGWDGVGCELRLRPTGWFAAGSCAPKRHVTGIGRVYSTHVVLLDALVGTWMYDWCHKGHDGYFKMLSPLVLSIHLGLWMIGRSEKWSCRTSYAVRGAPVSRTPTPCSVSNQGAESGSLASLPWPSYFHTQTGRVIGKCNTLFQQ